MAQDSIDSEPMEPIAFGVDRPADVYGAAKSARSFADSLGFTPAEQEEIALVVTELASNLVQHASGGAVRFSRIEAAGQIGIQIESEDGGPGIADLEQAVTDGYSTAGSLGIGLGTVNRLTDDLAAYPQPDQGVRIVCRRWTRPRTGGIFARDLTFGAATRSYRLLPGNGDTFIIKQWGRHALAGVIDGLGHGPFAQRASQTAREYVEKHFDQPLENLFLGVGRACRGTRGVVMALARFNLDQQKLTVASVGDVELRLIGSSERFNLVVKRGIVGLNAPSAVPTEHAWTSSSLLIMHSDGLRSHWAWDEFSHLRHAAPALVARRLLQVLGKMDDDATVVVARNATP